MIDRRTFVKAGAVGAASAVICPSMALDAGRAWAVDSSTGITDVDENSTLVTGGYLDFVVNHDIMKGSDGLFRPDDELTRAEAATVLCRGGVGAASDDPVMTVNTTGLTDVETGTWYTAAVNWAVASGVVTGYRNDDGTYTKFGPDDKALWQDFAVMLKRLVGKVYGKDASGSSNTSSGNSEL